VLGKLREAKDALELRVKARTLELARSEEELAVTVDSPGGGVIATDRESRVVRMHRVAERLTGLRAARAQGRALDDVVLDCDGTYARRLGYGKDALMVTDYRGRGRRAAAKLRPKTAPATSAAVSCRTARVLCAIVVCSCELTVLREHGSEFHTRFPARATLEA
jgi:PAS domain-containing protein